MSEQESVVFNLEVQVSEMTLSELRRLELIAYRAIGLLRRMGLPENVDAGIAKLQRLIMTIRLTHTALVALQAAMVPGVGWMAVAMAGITMAAVAFSASDFMMSVGE